MNPDKTKTVSGKGAVFTINGVECKFEGIDPAGYDYDLAKQLDTDFNEQMNELDLQLQLVKQLGWECKHVTDTEKLDAILAEANGTFMAATSAQAAPEAAQEALRGVLYETVEKAYREGMGGHPPSPQERQEALEAIDEMIADLDIETMSEDDFQTLARELGLSPRTLGDKLRSGVKVVDRRGSR